MEKKYDILLFGVTGFTGGLAAEHLLTKSYPVKWACCARNEAKAKAVLSELTTQLGKAAPVIEVADLVCKTPEDEAKLRAVVQKTRVVLTTAGPFEKYGQTLLKLCAEEGVHYADITGESDFFRMMIDQHDATARKTGAVCVVHCGHDCIPWDLSVLGMHQLAQSRNAQLVEASTFTELPAETAASGGTLTTAVYQLGKKRGGAAKPDFDPLLRSPDGTKSEFATKITSPKSDVFFNEFKKNGGPWIMSPVMANCVRRSNALLHYSSDFAYSEAQLRDPSMTQWVKDAAYKALVAAAIFAPMIFGGFLPQPGEGPSREVLGRGFLTVHGRGKAVDRSSGAKTKLISTFKFSEDVTYLSTARMLVEVGMLLLGDAGKGGGSVTTPAAGLGSAIVQRLVDQTGASFEIAVEEGGLW